MSLATAPSSPSSVDSREDSGDNAESIQSWTAGGGSDAEESDGVLSSDDGQDDRSLVYTDADRQASKKRSLSPATTSGTGKLKGPGTTEKDTIGILHDNDAYTGNKRQRPMKQLRAKPLSAALTSLLAAFKRQPMDLGTMDQRLHQGYYTDVDTFRSDFLLITQNAQTFNPPSSIYHTTARRLEMWGLRAIEREAVSAVKDSELIQTNSTIPRSLPSSSRRGRRRAGERPRRDEKASMPLDGDEVTVASPYVSEGSSRRTVRIGSARSTPWSAEPPEGVPDTPEIRLFRKTLAYAGVSAHTLTGKSACAARMQEKPKARLGPLPSILMDASGISSQAGESTDETQPTQNYTYLDDGSLDQQRLANMREYILQTVGPNAVMPPRIESLRHLPMTLAAPSNNNPQAEAALVFPPAQPGRPDPLGVAIQSQALPYESNWSHTFQDTSVPTDDRHLPFTLAGTPGPSSLSQGAGITPIPKIHRPVWPMPSAASLQDPLQSGLRLNRRERELEQERDEQNWTFFRPHLQRLMDATDTGIYSNLAAWVAITPDRLALKPYANVAGSRLTNALHEHLRAMPYTTLGLPRTAQYVPRASLKQLPTALQMSMQGAQEAERLIEVVYGGVLGSALVRSLAEFVGGAAASIHESNPSEIKSEDAHTQIKTEVNMKSESHCDLSPVSLREHESTQQSDSHYSISETATLPCSLVEYVKREVVHPLTGGLSDLLEHFGEQLMQIDVGVTPSSASDEPLYDLLDDKGSTLSKSLWEKIHPDKAAENPGLDEVLQDLLHAT
ncbi:pre-mRNA-splicing factor prp46 [Malassezia yamatoensis]|uniref:Pre-mRNA-splicing factor prp46 n=1 Tax=Malassezia yamatoensis TaxID=253288 RepID=A0AAJ6CHM9_9BASI|nr:pre-mRNA-splicing factor prp46 [Malassezia yamatoensis]